MRGALPLLVLVLAACCGRKQQSASSSVPLPAATTGQVLVYRAAPEHRDRVPVMLSDDGAITSFPDPRDVQTPDGPPLPSDLGKGYWLDNRGIAPNVAFLRLTYAEYGALEVPPSLAELEAAIVDRDPLLELCDCGKRSAYADVVGELRELVAKDALLTRCKKLK